MGLCQLHCENVREKMKDKNEQFIDQINDSYREVFELIMESIGVEDVFSSLTQEILQDPNSKEMNLMLYLHSIEPPFYAYLNDATQSMDQSKVSNLGPFAAVMQAI